MLYTVELSNPSGTAYVESEDNGTLTLELFLDYFPAVSVNLSRLEAHYLVDALTAAFTDKDGFDD